MQRKNRSCLNQAFHTVLMLPATVLGVGLTMSTPAVHASIDQLDEIIVTARRTDEVLQKVPISMTVFNQETLNERNVTNAADLVQYTPSLSVNNRFGTEQATFAIRGFTQEGRTTSSVAVYFADVVALRGSGNVAAGDGAGPGAFFDLQNVQVLKGPQGTLFGRNTTGGAIQLVPQEPTDTLEGYLEQSLGNYDMRRTQGVVNVPLSDSARARFGIDTMKRDGYQKNITDIGPDDFADVDYIAGRASLILDVMDDVQNYTVLTYSRSEALPAIQKLLACNPNPLLPGLITDLCLPALARQDDFYDVSNSDVADPAGRQKQWQGINTTTWDVTDDFSLKNIIAYGGLEHTMRGTTFGTDFNLPDSVAVKAPDGQPLHFYYFPAEGGGGPSLPMNSQYTFVEELQLSGTALDQRLSWQGGLYYEDSQPGHWSLQQSRNLLACGPGELGDDPAAWRCYDYGGNINPLVSGSVERHLAKVEYNNQAIYAQGTYDISDEWRVTLGLRYTVDRTYGRSQRTTWLGFPANGLGAPSTTKCSLSAASPTDCLYRLSQKSEAPTGLIGVDYLPTDNLMLYAKYTRGYRQGSVVTAAPAELSTYDPEVVDAYEIGAKTTFGGPIPGSFNVAVFYNELKDQQLQWGFIPLTGGAATTGILNAGKSKIQGAEVETTLRLLDDLLFNLSYTYLDTSLDTLDEPLLPVGWFGVASAVEGSHLVFSPRHAVATGLNYQLPLPTEIGNVSAGVSYSYTDSQVSSVTSDLGVLPSRRLVNLNLNWTAIYGSDFDAALFMTNAMDEEYNAYVTGMYNTLGAEFGVTGEPKMWGGRIKYNF